MIPHFSITAEQQLSLSTGRLAIPTDDVVLRVEGPGAVSCVQGLLTNDIEKVQVPSLQYGAVLTPKGMIISPLWVRRDTEGVWLIVPLAGADNVKQLLAKSFPPRLAKVSDRSSDISAWWVVGGEMPNHPDVAIALPDGPAPFDAIAIGVAETIQSMASDAGLSVGDPVLSRLAQLWGGWPTLGHEIDEKTLLQEVRFDELEAVKYDKGCYVGQETVSRLHFRGHANKTLRALHGSGEPPEDSSIKSGDKVVGNIATLARVDDRWIASAKIRREVATGDTVDIGVISSTVVEFPLDPGSTTA
jgi:folate-binding protein YgfZ